MIIVANYRFRISDRWLNRGDTIDLPEDSALSFIHRGKAHAKVEPAAAPQVLASKPAFGVSVVVLSCYPDIFNPLRDQLDKFEPAARKVLVTSGENGLVAPGWTVVTGAKPFVFGRNANMGIRECGGDDVFLMNDDTRIRGPVLSVLKETAYKQTDVGILVPQVVGGCGNPTQSAKTHLTEDLVFPGERLAFIAVYFKRSTLDKVGLFDERFSGYGCEDTDYCHRASLANLKQAVTPRVVILHGQGMPASSSFLRQMTSADQTASMLAMRKVYDEKWKENGLRLNLGCSDAHQPKPWINVDVTLPADQLADLNERWPWGDNTVSEIRAHDILEHLYSPMHSMNEAWRVLTPGGNLDIAVPTTDGRGAWQDPGHVSFWNRNSFMYFEAGNAHLTRFAPANGIRCAFKIVSEKEEMIEDRVAKLHIVLKAVK
jgi:hypothetical protein